MKKKIGLILSVLLVLQTLSGVFALTDEFIFNDTVRNRYTGRREAVDMLSTLKFTDIPYDHPQRESIMRAGALNMVKPYGWEFKPEASVSNEDVIEFVIRSLGQENLAQSTAVLLRNEQPADSPLQTLWSLGYLNIAMLRGLITQEQYNDAISDQSILDPAVNFMREGEAIRENVADWLYRGLRSSYATMFNTDEVQHKIYDFPDWSAISVDKVAAVEALTANGIMTATEDRIFAPKSPLTRADLIQILVNLDEIYYTASGIQKKTGTIGGMKDSQENATGTATLNRDIYVRVADGTIDVFQYVNSQSSSPLPAERDAVVYKDNEITGMGNLTEGDQIEYLVDVLNNRVLYIQVLSSTPNIEYVQGLLRSVSTEQSSITLADADGKEFTYPIVDGVLGNDGTIDYLYVNSRRRNIKELPIGSKLQVRLLNSIVDEVRYIGEEYVILEMRGIVIENNPAFGYMIFVDNNGNEVTKSYNSNDMKVEKQPYYETGDNGSYLDYVFPNFKYNPWETDISQIEAGDIVFLRLDPTNQDIILNISASTNYLLRYGKIKTFRNNGSTLNLTVEYENKQTAAFTVPSGIFISKDGRPITAANIMVGDWVKLLINQAIIEGGYVIETVKEMTIEGEEHFITKIVKGKLSSIDAVQNKLIISQAYTLEKNGWGYAKDLEQYSIRGRDIEYYYNDQRITLDYATKYLKNSLSDVYIALDTGFGGEGVTKVTFRDNFDQLMKPDTVVNADGNGNFTVNGVSGAISTDSGTIVRRYGRLVDGRNVVSQDYAVVSLNGYNHAAVVDITDAPDTSGFTVVRGRILSVDDAVGFKVQSMAMLNGYEWVYTPIQREFSIDANTLFFRDGQYRPLSDFISYESESVYGMSLNIIVEGGRAVRISDSPYSTQIMRGTIYDLLFDGIDYAALIKDAQYYNTETAQWSPVSVSNAIASVTVRPDSLIGRNNVPANANSLKIGEQIRVMTSDPLPEIGSGMSITGHIILIEN